MGSSILNYLIFIPLVATLLVLVVPSTYKSGYKMIALGASVLQLVFAILLYLGYSKGAGSPVGLDQLSEFQFVTKLDWISMNLGSLGKLSIDYFVGIDGLSVTMVFLSVIVMLVGVIASWNVTEKQKGYFALYLILNTAVIGCFTALDMFLFYLFFEFMLLPMYFLIGIWGGARREYASIKFFLYTLLGSVFILVVMIGLYSSVIDPVETGALIGINDVTIVQQMLATGTIDSSAIVRTFDMVAMTNPANYIPNSVLGFVNGGILFDLPIRLIAFLMLFIGFAIKIPVVPVHTWLPDAHVEASTPISVVLAGILLKIGGYGLIRVGYAIFPDGAVHWAWLVGGLGVLSIIYGGFNALASKDLKRLIAYSSISHMGFVLLGLASVTVEGVSGAMYQMFSHGIISAALFLIAGVLYDRTHDRMIKNYSGLASKMPKYTVVVVITFFASLGLPGFSGFIAEIFVFLGAFKSFSVNQLLPRWMAIVATFGLLLSAAYYLWTIQRMYFGKFMVKESSWNAKLADLTTREYVLFIPLILLMLLFGIFPQLLLDFTNSSIEYFVLFVNEQGVENLQKLLSK
jgi:NADH-quinone oxidoreductase subunit M